MKVERLILSLLLFVAVFVALFFFMQSNEGFTGNVVGIDSKAKKIVNTITPIKSDADKCAEKYFSCIQRCPPSLLDARLLSYTCFVSCAGTYGEECGEVGYDLSYSNEAKIDCLGECMTDSKIMTYKINCMDNCL